MTNTVMYLYLREEQLIMLHNTYATYITHGVQSATKITRHIRFFYGINFYYTAT